MRSIRESLGIMHAMNESRFELQECVRSLKMFADVQLLKFDDLETDNMWYSFDDRLLYKFAIDTTSIFSTENQEYAQTTVQAFLEYIVRGMEAYAYWHNLFVGDIRVDRTHWFNYRELVVSFK